MHAIAAKLNREYMLRHAQVNLFCLLTIISHMHHVIENSG